MKTFAEAFAASGMDEWDAQQAIKRLQAQLKRNLTRQGPRTFPAPADFAQWHKTGLTGPALTAAYVKLWERMHTLRASPPALVAVAPAPTLTPVIPANAGIQPAAPATHVDLQRPARRQRASPKPCRRNPLTALLDAVHDAHLAAREAARRTRRHIATS